MRILALDVGTSSVKAAILDTGTAEPIGPIAHVSYRMEAPTPDAAEVSPTQLWSAVAAAAREASRGAAGAEALGFSCMTPALVLMGKNGRPVAPIWTHLDRRARQAARQVNAALGDEFLASVGNLPLPGGISALCWRQQLAETPYLGREVHHYLHLNGWLAFHITGEPAFDPANANFTGLFGLRERAWSPRWCEYFQVDPLWLPPVVSGDTTIGHVRSAVAAELGVPPGLPVKLGTADTSSAMLAAAMHPGDLLHVVGTTQVLGVLTTTPHPSPRRLLHHLGVGAAYTYVTHNPVGGAAFEWIRQLCFRDQEPAEFYQTTIDAALGRTTRVTLDPPYLGGDRLEIEAHRAAFRDLTVTTDRLDLLAAVLEAMRRQHAKALSDLGANQAFQRIFLTGGGADVVQRLLPEYSGSNVYHFEEGSLRGVARLFPGGQKEKRKAPDREPEK